MKIHKSLIYPISAAILLAGSFFYALSTPSTHETSSNPKSGITFLEGQWTAAKQKAAAEHKYIFVDAYATWCPPCKQLKKITFQNKEVADFFNSHFINVSLDVEKGEGADFASQYNIEAMPTLIIFDPSGRPKLKSLGYIDPANLLAFAKQALQ